MSTEFILDKDFKNKTIEEAVNLVDKMPSVYKNWKSKETGLQLVLLGLAEVNALRVAQLAGLVFQLEREIFKIDNIRDLEPRRAIELYKMGIDALNSSSTYVKNILTSVNWENLELQLLTIQEDNREDKPIIKSGVDISKVASELLVQLGQMQSTFNK